MNNCYEILGIEPTKDEKKIKQAYAKKLKECDKDDVLLLQELHDAFNLARRMINNSNEDEVIVSVNLDYVELNRLLYTDDGNVVDKVFEGIDLNDIDQSISYFKEIIQFTYDNLTNMSQEVLYKIGESIGDIELDYRLNSNLYEIKQYYQFRTFQYSNLELFSKYHEFRNMLIDDIIYSNYQHAYELFIANKDQYPVWERELNSLGLLLDVLRDGTNKRDAYSQCHKALKNDDDNPLFQLIFVLIYHDVVIEKKLYRNDEIMFENIKLGNASEKIKISFEEILGMDLMQNFQIKFTLLKYIDKRRVKPVNPFVALLVLLLISLIFLITIFVAYYAIQYVLALIVFAPISFFIILTIISNKRRKGV